MTAYVYILASKPYGTLYTGVTTNLEGRIYDHKQKLREGFTKKYGVTQLVWYDDYHDVRDAITREKQIKKWYRQWKIDLIEKTNPEWKDLYETLGI